MPSRSSQRTHPRSASGASSSSKPSRPQNSTDALGLLRGTSIETWWSMQADLRTMDLAPSAATLPRRKRTREARGLPEGNRCMSMNWAGLAASSRRRRSHATALLAAGCGDERAPTSRRRVAIEATGTARDVTYEAPPRRRREPPRSSSPTRATRTGVDGQLVYTAEEHSDQEVVAELGKAFQGQPVADWFQGGGGVGTTPKGESATVTQDLQEGTYYVVGERSCQDPADQDHGHRRRRWACPDADGTVTAAEYSFTSRRPALGREHDPAGERRGAVAPLHRLGAEGRRHDRAGEDSILQSEGEGAGPPPFAGDRFRERGLEHRARGRHLPAGGPEPPAWALRLLLLHLRQAGRPAPRGQGDGLRGDGRLARALRAHVAAGWVTPARPRPFPSGPRPLRGRAGW